jgi:hypothetical protein
MLLMSDSMLTEAKIRSLCGNYHSAAPSEQKSLKEVSQWGLRHLFDGGCSEYNVNNIFGKISTIEAICNLTECSFSDVIGAFTQDQCEPSRTYRLSGTLSFFNDVFDGITDEVFIKQGHYDPIARSQTVSQIITFTRNREWEKWAGFMSPEYYRIVESQFSRIFDFYFMRNRPLPLILN